MSQNTKTHNSGQEGGSRRNDPPPYNLRPLQPQEEEQEGNEQPPMARRQKTRRQPRRETRTERLEQRIDMLTELVNTLVTALDQNAANATPAIPPGIPLANAGGEESLPTQGDGKVAADEAQVDTDVRQRRARRRHRARSDSRRNMSDLRTTEHTRDSVFDRLKRIRANPNLDDGYNS